MLQVLLYFALTAFHQGCLADLSQSTADLGDLCGDGYKDCNTKEFRDWRDSTWNRDKACRVHDDHMKCFQNKVASCGALELPDYIRRWNNKVVKCLVVCGDYKPEVCGTEITTAGPTTSTTTTTTTTTTSTTTTTTTTSGGNNVSSTIETGGSNPANNEANEIENGSNDDEQASTDEDDLNTSVTSAIVAAQSASNETDSDEDGDNRGFSLSDLFDNGTGHHGSNTMILVSLLGVVVLLLAAM